MWGGGSNKTKYGGNLDFRKRTREKFDWNIEDELDGLLELEHEIHTELAYEFPGELLEENIPGPVAFMETKILEPNDISSAAAANSSIINTRGVYYGIDNPTPFLKINPTPDL